MQHSIPLAEEFHIKDLNPRFRDKHNTVALLRDRLYHHQSAEMMLIDINGGFIQYGIMISLKPGY